MWQKINHDHALAAKGKKPSTQKIISSKVHPIWPLEDIWTTKTWITRFYTPNGHHLGTFWTTLWTQLQKWDEEGWKFLHFLMKKFLQNVVHFFFVQLFRGMIFHHWFSNQPNISSNHDANCTVRHHIQDASADGVPHLAVNMITMNAMTAMSSQVMNLKFHKNWNSNTKIDSNTYSVGYHSNCLNEDNTLVQFGGPSMIIMKTKIWPVTFVGDLTFLKIVLFVMHFSGARSAPSESHESHDLNDVQCVGWMQRL